jgi:proteic killer suppression protein
VIVSFADDATEALWTSTRSAKLRRLPPAIHSIAMRKLLHLAAAVDLNDLTVPPGNRLEALKGDLRGLYSIRINDQWRLVFRWQAGNAYDVRITDYH